MLGIGKIRPGRETYHLDAVADGVEDYYFAAHEAPGVWVGGGAVALGLTGTVSRDQLVALLGGVDPRTGAPLTAGRAQRGVSRLPGYDVTLRSPKSVSLLWALTTDDGVRAEIQRGHDAAVRDTLRHLEAVAAEARRGAHGSVRMPTTGYVAAAFRHRTSRAGDPVLHTHLVIPNIVQGIDGRWSAPNGTMLYANAKSGGYVYQALLRGELTRRLGVAWGPVHKGAADLAGTGPEVIRAFSRRRAEIEARRDLIAERATRPTSTVSDRPTTVTAEQVAAERAERLRNAGATTQLAALETRTAKDGSVDMAALVTEWRARAAGLGYDGAAQQAQLGVRSAAQLGDIDREEIATRLVGESDEQVQRQRNDPVHLCARASTWSRRDALMGWCSLLRQGAASLEQLDEVTDSFLHSHPAVIRAEGQPGLRPGDGIRLATGAFVPARGDLVRYTTRRMRAIEEGLVAAALDRVGEGVAVASAAAVTEAITLHARNAAFPLTPEQQAMIIDVVTSGRGVEVVVGRAGSGKTTALAVARRAWEGSGHTVRGAAKAAVAARHLELAAGMRSQTLDSLLLDVRSGRSPLPRGGVLVLDEAATTETPLLAELLSHARARRWKVLLVGDDQQLAEIDAGGGFRGLRLRLGARVLSENLRQRHEWEREAVGMVRAGRGAEALAAYIAHSRVAITDTREAACRLMAARWWRRRDDGGSELLQAHRNADVRVLNRLVHERRVAVGEVGATALRCGVEIGVGDRVLTRLAARSDGILNGMRGVVTDMATAPGHESITVRLDDGETRRFGHEYLARTNGEGLPALDLAYATTIHRNQGITADRSQTLVDSGVTADAAYVALSRGRESNEIVLVAAPAHGGDGVSHWDPDATPRRALADCLRGLENGAVKHLSLDALAEERAPLATAARREQLDGLVAAWRRSLSADCAASAEPTHGHSPADEPSEEATDPHLIAIRELLEAPRAELLDAVVVYRSRLAALERGPATDAAAGAAPSLPARRPRPADMASVLPGARPDDDTDEQAEHLHGGAASLRRPRLG